MKKDDAKYIPALTYHWLTRFYDPLLRWTMREMMFKRQLIQQAQIKKRHRVLDLGCGTATLTLLLKQTYPEAEIVGVDGDPYILQIAKTKALKTGVDITLDEGMAFELPYANSSFDRVLSSLLFHHLTRENKNRTLREVFRILRPGGELHIADWGKPHTAFTRAAFLVVQALDGMETTKDNREGLLPELIHTTGFTNVGETDRYMTVFGTLSLYKGRKASPAPRE